MLDILSDDNANILIDTVKKDVNLLTTLICGSDATARIEMTSVIAESALKIPILHEVTMRKICNYLQMNDADALIVYACAMKTVCNSL